MGGFIAGFLEDRMLRAVQRLKPIADEAGLTLPQLALAWVLREPNVASAIIGAVAARAGPPERRRRGRRARAGRPDGDRRRARRGRRGLTAVRTRPRHARVARPTLYPSPPPGEVAEWLKALAC